MLSVLVTTLIQGRKQLWIALAILVVLAGGFIGWMIGSQVIVAESDITPPTCAEGPWALATYNGYKSLDDVADRADLVIKGKVIGRRVTIDMYQSEMTPWAIHDIEVIETFKGEPNNTVITLGRSTSCLEQESTYYLFLRNSATAQVGIYQDDPDEFQNPADYKTIGPQGRYQVVNNQINPEAKAPSLETFRLYNGIPDSAFAEAVRGAIR